MRETNTAKVIKLIGVTLTCMEMIDWNWNKNDVVFDNVKRKIIFATISST